MNSVKCKMKKLTVLVLAIVTGTSGFLIKVPVAPKLEPALAPLGWIHLQKLVIPLFENVCEASTDPIICRLSEELPSALSPGDFWDPEVITKFQTLKTGKGFLPKGQIFSEYNAEHINELKVVFDVMRNAKSFDTFYKVAAWARQNLNCGLYVNLIYLAMENRPDTEKLTLPPPYELLPNYFIRKDIIIQGSSLLAGEEFTPTEGVRDEGNGYTLDANYTANFYDNDDESKLAYFREDIGLNSYYFLGRLKLAPWLNGNVNINSRYGEEMYHMMKQLVARYNLERYSNGLPVLDNLSWDSFFDAPYDPMLVYSNGNEFIHRTSSVQLPENEDKALLQTIESNIATVVSHMKEAGYNKTQILNHLMEILVTGERSYDTLARLLLGKALSNNGQPTVFEHYLTSLRDPMIWKLYKKIVDLVDNALQVLPPYTKSELYFPGVEVMGVDVKKVMTNFDYFEFDITEALKIGNGDTTFQVKIGQPRLNHKPFVVKLNISSYVTQKGLVKIYLGPKMMPGEFAKKKNLFNLLDTFEINLKRGSNIMTRTSNEMKMFSSDFISLKTLKKRVEDAQFGLDSLPMNSINSQIGFPERLTIPRGTPEGLPLQLFIFIAPFVKATVGGPYSTLNTEFNTAASSPLYPLDLAMEDRVLLDLPNAFVKDLVVTHKGINKVSNYGGAGAPKTWYDNNGSGPPSQPNFYAGENGPFDYNSKKIQIGQDDNTFHANDQYFGDQIVNYNDGVQNDDPAAGLTQNLKASGYDYSSKQKQPFDYNSKRPQYQKPDYLSKKVDYKTLYNNKATAKSLDMNDENKNADKEIINEGQNIDIIYTPTDRYNDVNQNIDNLNNETQSSESPVRPYYVLKSSGSDFSGTPTQTIDSYSKRTKFEKPDYKTMYKTFRKTTEKPTNIQIDDKITEQVSQVKKGNNDDLISESEQKVGNFRIIKEKNKIEASKETPTNKYYDDVVVEDVGNDDAFKVVRDKISDDFPSVVPDSKYDSFFVENVQNTDGREFFGLFKNDGNEELVKVVPMAESPLPDTNANTIYKYIMHGLNTDLKTDKDTSIEEQI